MFRIPVTRPVPQMPTDGHDVHTGGVWFYGWHRTFGNRRLRGFWTPSESLYLRMSRLDVRWRENGRHRMYNVFTGEPRTLDEVGALLNSGIYYVGEAGWEARLISVGPRVRRVVLHADWGPLE